MKLSALLLAALARVPTVRAAEVYQVIYPSFNASLGDAVIFSDEPDQAAGGSDLIVGCNGNNQCARSLLHFAVDHLPDDAVITAVQMTLLAAASVEASDPPMTMDLHRVTRPWSRTTASIPDGERDSWPTSLAGTAAAAGDVTWKYAVYPDRAWETAGGDVDAAVLTSVVSAHDDSGARAGPLFFPATDAFRTLVQGWIDGTVPNHGVLVKRDDDTDPSDARMRILFHEQSGNKDYRSPKLLITYTSASVPEQMPSPPSGPGILLPGEPTRAPTTSSPTTAPACPVTATGVEIYQGTSSQHATLFLDNGMLAQDRGPFGVGVAHSGEILRGLLHFPVDAIPAGATITCAEIVVKTTGPCGPCKGLVDVAMHRVTAPWTTTGTNDFLPQQQPLLYQVELQGAGANTGDVTWTHATYDAADPDGGGVRWATPGGDVDPAVLSTEVDDERGQHKFPSSPGFVAAIQGMVDGTAANHGFLFKTEESPAYVALKAEENTYKDYDSAYRLFKAEDEAAEADRPLLVVHYTPLGAAPTPASPAGTGPGPTVSAAPSENVCAGVVCDDDGDGPCWCDPCPRCYEGCVSFPCPYLAPVAPSSIYGILAANVDGERPSNIQWNTLKAAIDAAGLAEALSGDGSLTLFAPTDDAFAKAPLTPELLEWLLLPRNADTLGAILKYHVVAAKVPSAAIAPGLVPTLNGASVDVQKFPTGIRVGDANVLEVYDVEATNGIVHAIDRVLVPAGLALPSFDTSAPTGTPVTAVPTQKPASPAAAPVGEGEAANGGTAMAKSADIKTLAALCVLSMLVA